MFVDDDDEDDIIVVDGGKYDDDDDDEQANLILSNAFCISLSNDSVKSSDLYMCVEIGKKEKH